MNDPIHIQRTNELALVRLRVVPLTLKEAHVFVREFHRHHKPSVGGLFAVAVAQGSRVCGVAIVGRPVSRMLADGYTAEVTRLATDGSRNACSMLYAAAWRAARGMGYSKLITYILDTEPGTTLKAAGWKMVHQTRAQSWDRDARPRVDTAPIQGKLRWEVTA